MATTLKPVDVVVIGMGWAGGIMAKELVQAGLQVVGLERGRDRRPVPDFQPPHIHDELRYAIRLELFQSLHRESVTFRNSIDQMALPTRRWGAFPMGEGLGGSGVHWSGQTWRFPPWNFQMRSQTIERYGESAIPADSTIQDWGLTYEELEPYYDRFEYTAGISGKAGNLNGQIQPGGNPFEAPRSREYPNPPMKQPYESTLSVEAATRAGWHPFPMPSANLSRPYENPDGVQMGGCLYCGNCTLFGCEVNAKSSSLACVLPAIFDKPNFDLRTNCHVLKINLNAAGDRAESVTYVDAVGAEYTQPAELIVLSAYALNNVRLLLLSQIGQPYDPKAGTGLVGKNYSYQPLSFATFFFEDKVFQPYIGAGGLGICWDDFNNDNFDHTGLGFIGGGVISVNRGGAGPVQSRPAPPGTPRWGSPWKAAVAKYYTRSFGMYVQECDLAYRDHYLDLDPNYVDLYGQPLLRMTYDFGPNERKIAEYMAGIFNRFADELGADQRAVGVLPDNFPNFGVAVLHNNGGAIMGVDRTRSVVNKYLQSWDVPNLFVVGASAFPQNPGYNPTGTVGALSFWAADAARRYMQSPGPLVR